MVHYTVFVPVVVALFLAILSVYIYVHKMVCKSREELARAIRENRDDRKEQFDRVNKRLDKLENHIGGLATSFQELRVAYEGRFTRLEAKRDTPLSGGNPQ